MSLLEQLAEPAFAKDQFIYLVVTSQVGIDQHRGRRVLSTAVTVLAVCFLVVYGSIVFETLSTHDATFTVHRTGAYAQLVRA